MYIDIAHSTKRTFLGWDFLIFSRRLFYWSDVSNYYSFFYVKLYQACWFINKNKWHQFISVVVFDISFDVLQNLYWWSFVCILNMIGSMVLYVERLNLCDTDMCRLHRPSLLSFLMKCKTVCKCNTSVCRFSSHFMFNNMRERERERSNRN